MMVYFGSLYFMIKGAVWSGFIVFASMVQVAWIAFKYMYMGESSKCPKSWTLEIKNLKLAGCLQKLIIACLNG